MKPLRQLDGRAKTLALSRATTDFRAMANSPKTERRTPNSRAASHRATARPRVLAAPGMLDGKVVTVTREEGESDERYQTRCELVGILIESATRG